MKKECPVKYFEICISPEGEDSLDSYWICIKGVREPSLEEAEAFLTTLEAKERVIDVVEIDEADALVDYNFDNETDWPVFGLHAA